MPKCSLRDVNQDDHYWLIDLHNDVSVLHNLTDPTVVTYESHIKWWTNRSTTQEHFIFCVDDVDVGFTKFSFDYNNKNVVLGADIHESFRGKGYSYQMYELMLDYVFLNKGMFRASLTTASYNEIGKHIYEKLGFLKEGVLTKSLLRNNKYYDQICYYMLKEHYLANK